MMTKHPDIEIYIKNTPVEKVLTWLSKRLDRIDESSSKGLFHHFTGEYQQQTFDVVIHERALGKSWISVWFQTDQTPWNIDLDCAREASIKLNAQVRCIASGWQEGQDPDEWYRVEKGIEEKIQWITD